MLSYGSVKYSFKKIPNIGACIFDVIPCGKNVRPFEVYKTESLWKNIIILCCSINFYVYIEFIYQSKGCVIKMFVLSHNSFVSNRSCTLHYIDLLLVS